MSELKVPVVPSAFLERLPSILEHPDLGNLRAIVTIAAGYLAHYWTSNRPAGSGTECRARVAIEHVVGHASRGYIEVIGYEKDDTEAPVLVVKVHKEPEDPSPQAPGCSTYIERPAPLIEEAADFPENIEDLSVDLLSDDARVEAQTFFDSLEASPTRLHALLEEMTVHCPASCN
jgi:hypothetical protein